MTGKQLMTLEQAYLMALCVMDLYRLQSPMEALNVAQFAACSGLDWTEMDELKEHLSKRGIDA